ncbi:PQQ-binding-like beta-propeller repeat protein [Stratiformator vulcanicus]|uniref:Outer membrane protein assembly factor BamB n=1 Tax=Stratiformator vulcanicus TaxID=2527980 RepID=A0A517R612_9PLAN|nr:PQQ-binding-like beta-propeller repeat protein [Stratiformator vulcanicus]QDT39299.1 Outer membrane protein assembly factor BamB precursor [Stratiformator vulcanicus]
MRHSPINVTGPCTVVGIRVINLALIAITLLLGGLGPDTAFAQRSKIPSNSFLRRYGLERAWLGRATIDARQDIVKVLSGDEEVMFCSTRAGVLSAFDAESGRKLWTQLSPRVQQFLSDVVTDKGRAFTIVGEKIYAINKLSGAIEWELRVPFVPVSHPVFDETQMYVATLDGSVYAFNIEKVEKYSKEGLLPQYIEDTIVWRYNTGIRIVSPPAVSEGHVVFGTANGNVFGVSASDRSELFQFEVDTKFSAPLIAKNGIVYLPTAEATMYAVRMRNGTSAWEFIAGTQISQPVLPIGDSVFLIAENQGLFRVERKIGDVHWRDRQIEQFLAVSNTRAYGGAERGKIVVDDRETGRRIGSFTLADFKVRMTNPRTDRLYMATEAGVVMCVREIASDFPVYHEAPDLRPILPEFAQ